MRTNQGWGWQPVAAPKSAGAARKCGCAGGAQRRDRWCRSPPSMVFMGHGLACCGHQRRNRAGARGLLAPSPSVPSRGVGRCRAEPCPWCAVERQRAPSALRSPPPGRTLPLSGSFPPTGSLAARLPLFLSPFLGFCFCSFFSCWSFSPSPTGQSAPLAYLLILGFQNY